jgi:uncharacterized phiE125 gp8 family phage protein
MGREMSYLNKITQPTTEPITLAEAQLHLRLDTEGSPPSHPDDELVETLISASRETIESHTGQTLAPCEFVMEGKVVSSELNLKTYPVTSIASVTYEDSDGAIITVDPVEYKVSNFERPSRLVFKSVDAEKLLTVNFTAGFTDGQSPNSYPMPDLFKAATKIMVANLYENRESTSEKEQYERLQSLTYILGFQRTTMGL